MADCKGKLKIPECKRGIFNFYSKISPVPAAVKSSFALSCDRDSTEDVRVVWVKVRSGRP
jgi:hypothetical protein